MKNKKGQNDLEGVVGSIISLILIVFLVSALIPVFSNIGSDDEQKKIDSLKRKVSELEKEVEKREIKISELQSRINSTNKTLNEKEDLIANLTGKLEEKNNRIENLTKQLSYLEEKKYLNEINNNYYNISNEINNIEKKFFPISISISLISITLIIVVIKQFSVICLIRKWFKRLKNIGKISNRKGNSLNKKRKENDKQ